MDYVALQVKTSYSLLSSLNDIKKLIKKAKELGYTSLAISDTNNMFGVMQFYKECKQNNLKPIIGTELIINEAKIILYAENINGYQNLIKLVTIVSDRALTINDLKQYSANLIGILPFTDISMLEQIKNLFPNLYIGYTNANERDQIKLPKVYINDVLYLEKKDYQYLDYVYMIKDGKKLGEYELNTHQGHHLLSSSEIELVSTLSDVLNTKKISEMCNVEFSHNPSLLPIYDVNVNAYDYLSSLCHKGLKKRLNNEDHQDYVDRLDYELSVINKMGFCNYFLVVWDYVKYAKNNNILCTARGSAAGSLVSYTLGITDVDPIKYNLLFERFLNPERITMPDIDMDFDSDKRSQVVDYVVNKYGEKKVAGIITFGTLAAKQVIRDVSRVMGISLNLVDKLASLINPNQNLSEAYQDQKLKELIDSSAELTKLYDIALHLEGIPRHTSIHAAGIIMSNEDLDNVVPLYRNEMGIYLSGYSMEHLEELGLLKMDFLGLSNFTLITDVINNIKAKEKINISFNNIPMDDSKTLEVFTKVNTNGIFQFESPGMKKFLEKLKPSSLEDIFAAIALFRPGPMDNIDAYIKRKYGKEQIDYIHPDLVNILKPTYGIIIYQEQIMQIASVMAGYSLGEADVLRRAISKKKEEILLKEQDKFINQSINKGYSKEIATKVFNLILKFANYGFNRGHSVVYAIIAYKMAFLKQHFPKYFMSSLLTNVIGSETKTRLHIIEARTNNIDILMPDINYSTNKYQVDDLGIRCPFLIIRNVGITSCLEIMKEREKGEYLDFIDFIVRIYGKSINHKTLEALIDAGCFSNMGYNKKTLINNLDTIINYADLVKDVSLIIVDKPEMIIYEEYSKEELMQKELQIFGFYLSMHPVSKYKISTDLNTFEINKYVNQNIDLILYVEKLKEIVTKKNEVMAFIDGSDEYSSISVTLFPIIYEKHNGLKMGNIIKVNGKVEKRFDKYQVIANKVDLLE